MYESKPRRREGEPIESLVGDAIELTASRSGGGPGTGFADGAAEVDPGERARAGQSPRTGDAAGSRTGGMGSGLRLPWDGWDQDRLRVALLVAVAAAAVETLTLIAVLVAALA